MTVRAQDDHLIAGTWAACGEIRNLVHIKCESFIVLCSYITFIFSKLFYFKNYSFPRWNLIWFNPINIYTVFCGKDLWFPNSKHILA